MIKQFFSIQYMRLLSVTSLGVMIALAGSFSALDRAAAETLQEKRIAMFKKSGSDIKAVFKTHLPNGDVAAIRAFGEEMAQWGADMPSHFPKGSANEGAKASIWEDWADFQDKTADFTVKANAVVLATQQEDLSAIENAVKALGGACKACHQQYRQKK